MPTRGEAKRLRLFERGATALAHLKPDLPDELYICPICGDGYTRDEVLGSDPRLTIEDAPPRSSGRRSPVALTCRPCNSSSGHELDSHFKARENLLRFAANRSGLFRGWVSMGDDRLAATVSTQPRSVHVNIPTDANYDATARGALANLQEGAPFQVVFPSFKQHEANVSLLRSAFIAAFAFLGYRYAFASTTASIRRQILIPTEFVLDGYSVLEPDAPGDRKQLAVSFDGDGNWFLLVLMGWHIVALPGLKQDPASLYQELRARSPDNRLRVRADLVGWPTAMEMHLDALKA